MGYLDTAKSLEDIKFMLEWGVDNVGDMKFEDVKKLFADVEKIKTFTE